MPKQERKRIMIKDLPKRAEDKEEEELTTRQAKAVNGGRLIGSQDPNLVGDETPALRTDSPSSDDSTSL
jgi:hypothetical protein